MLIGLLHLQQVARKSARHCAKLAAVKEKGGELYMPQHQCFHGVLFIVLDDWHDSCLCIRDAVRWRHCE
jgi:hypothetical protein